MLEQTNVGELNRRASLIRQAISRGAGRFFGGEKLLFPIADYMLLAFQSPSCFSIWNERGKLIFTSFRDPHIVGQNNLKTGNHLLAPEACKIELSLLSPELKNYYVTFHDITPNGFEPFDKTRLNLVREVILKDNCPAYPDSFPYALADAIEEHTQSVYSDSNCTSAEALSDQQIENYLNPMRDILDDAFGELREHQSFSVELSDGSHIPNVFAVVRTVRGKEKRFSCFPYTASLLLSNSQKRKLPSICRDANTFQETARQNCSLINCGERCISLLEAPLSTSARAIYDSVFYSGCVDFGLVGEVGEAGKWRDIPGNADEDKLRQEVERCVYGVLTSGRQSQIIYVPIHIGGVPWLSLFTLTPIEDESSWDDTYCFYRDIVAKLSDRLRQGAQDAYLDALVSEFRDCLPLSSGDFFNAVNKKWLRVAQVYPYNSFEITPSAPGKGAISLLRGVYANLKEYPNQFCASQLNYGHLQVDSLHKRLQQEADLLTRIERESDEGMRDRLQSQAHTILNNLPVGTLSKAMVADSSYNIRKFANDAKCYLEIVEIAFLIALGRDLPYAFPANKPEGTVIDVLEWIKERQPSDKIDPVFVVNDDCVDVCIPDSFLPSAFTVIWNLWHNAETVARGKVRSFFAINLSMSKSGEWLEVEFINSGEMSVDWITFLKRGCASPNKKKHRSGLEIVMTQLPTLGWELIPPEMSAEDLTKLTLRIPVSVET